MDKCESSKNSILVIDFLYSLSPSLFRFLPNFPDTNWSEPKYY